MNILEYIEQGGKCKSKAGYDFTLTKINLDEYWCINGTLDASYNFKMKMKWNKDGVPHGLPYTHGLDLMPVVPIVDYKMISKEILSKYDDVEEFIKQEGKQ